MGATQMRLRTVTPRSVRGSKRADAGILRLSPHSPTALSRGFGTQRSYRGSMQENAAPWREWTEFDAARCIAVPGADDDKYSRGVLGVVTGSRAYPGAAVLGVEAASRAGLGMIRYLGPGRASDMVLRARPEVVTAPGRVQAWLAGSGMDPDDRSERSRARLALVTGGDRPVVLDAGALDLVDRISAPAVLTPHAGELVTLLGRFGIEVDRAAVNADPAHWAEHAADRTGTVVLLKGRVTHVCAPATGGERRALTIQAPSSWAATAGSGDVLGGIVGALVATHSEEVLQDATRLVDLAATGAYIHAWAAAEAAASGPITALDIARATGGVVRRLVGGMERGPRIED